LVLFALLFSGKFCACPVRCGDGVLFELLDDVADKKLAVLLAEPPFKDDADAA
jgi:hypothetical protein